MHAHKIPLSYRKKNLVIPQYIRSDVPIKIPWTPTMLQYNNSHQSTIDCDDHDVITTDVEERANNVISTGRQATKRKSDSQERERGVVYLILSESRWRRHCQPSQRGRKANRTQEYSTLSLRYINKLNFLSLTSTNAQNPSHQRFVFITRRPDFDISFLSSDTNNKISTEGFSGLFLLFPVLILLRSLILLLTILF